MSASEITPQEETDLTWALMIWETARDYGILTQDEAETVEANIEQLDDARARAEEFDLLANPDSMAPLIAGLVENCYYEISWDDCLARAQEIVRLTGERCKQ